MDKVNRFLFDFSYVRKLPEALALYIVHSILSIGAVWIYSHMDSSLETDLPIAALVYTVGMTAVACRQRNLENRQISYLIATGLLTILATSVGGLVPLFYLVAKDTQKKSKKSGNTKKK